MESLAAALGAIDNPARESEARAYPRRVRSIATPAGGAGLRSAPRPETVAKFARSASPICWQKPFDELHRVIRSVPCLWTEIATVIVLSELKLDGPEGLLALLWREKK